MQTLMILALHIAVCVLLVILVLLQAGKEGMGVIFGGGGGSVFGSGGAGSMLAKMTAFMAILFVFTSLGYTYMTSTRTAKAPSVLEGVRIEEPAPATMPPVQSSDALPVTETPPVQAVQPVAPVDKVETQVPGEAPVLPQEGTTQDATPAPSGN